MIRGEDGGNISSSDEVVDQEIFTQMKKRVEVMEKGNQELKTALLLGDDLLKQFRLEKENNANLVKSKEDQMEQFQLKMDNMAEMVKCPVCLMLPRENKPVPCCPRGHFVCSTCKDQLTRQNLPCPTCRIPMGEGQSLLALAVVKEALHECSLPGCGMKLPFDKIKEHENTCQWRRVRCPGGGSRCNRVVPFCQVLTHVEECNSCKLAVDYERILKSDGVMQDKMALSKRLIDGSVDGKLDWKTVVLFFQGQDFFVRRFWRNGCFLCEVMMKGTKEECRGYVAKVSVVDAESRQAMLTTSFSPRPLETEYEIGFCLSAPKQALSEVWKYEAARNVYLIYVRVELNKL